MTDAQQPNPYDALPITAETIIARYQDKEATALTPDEVKEYVGALTEKNTQLIVEQERLLRSSPAEDNIRIVDLTLDLSALHYKQRKEIAESLSVPKDEEKGITWGRITSVGIPEQTSAIMTHAIDTGQLDALRTLVDEKHLELQSQSRY